MADIPLSCYSFPRLSGPTLSGPGLYQFPAPRSCPGEVVLTGFDDRRDRTRFAAAYNDPESGITTGPRAPHWPVCVGFLAYAGQDLIKADIANFKAALEANGIDEGFMSPDVMVSAPELPHGGQKRVQVA